MIIDKWRAYSDKRRYFYLLPFVENIVTGKYKFNLLKYICYCKWCKSLSNNFKFLTQCKIYAVI